MDTSKEYIKMCEKAEEIQIYGRDNFERLRPLIGYDLLLKKCCIVVWSPKTLREKLGLSNDELVISIEQDKDDGIYIPEGTEGALIWLPYKDQLQKIAKQTHPNPNPFTEILQDLSRLDEFIYPTDDGLVADYLKWSPKSMEQLWLAFVMKEKFNKVWDRESWKQGGK